MKFLLNLFSLTVVNHAHVSPCPAVSLALSAPSHTQGGADRTDRGREIISIREKRERNTIAEASRTLMLTSLYQT